MEKKSNKKKSKLKINSLEHSLFEDLVKHELNQVKGGYSGYPPFTITPLKKHMNTEPFIIIVPVTYSF